MEDKTKLHLTAPEMASLWTQYLNDSLAVCVMSYFLEKAEDEELQPIIEWTLDTAKENISIMQELFEKESFPLPVGFTEQDVNPKAPKLFTDTFMLVYLKQMSMFATTASGGALGVVTRPDIVAFHKRVYEKGIKLADKSRELLLKQGTLIKLPSISIPQKADFVKKQHFLAGFFGEKRALTAIEITHLYLNAQTNAIGKAIVMGFAQIAQNDEVKQFLVRGKDLSQKYVNVLSEFLIKEDIPAPTGWDTSVLNTTGFVFSDKLIMFHISAMFSAAIGNCGMAIAASQRRDIGLKYMSMIPEVVLYAEDGANIMIKHGWMEEPPQAVNRAKILADNK